MSLSVEDWAKIALDLNTYAQHDVGCADSRGFECNCGLSDLSRKALDQAEKGVASAQRAAPATDAPLVCHSVQTAPSPATADREAIAAAIRDSIGHFRVDMNACEHAADAILALSVSPRMDGDEGLRARVAELEAILNAPELHDFAKGVVLEAGHQRERWGSDHDAGKAPLDWFWLIGFLAQKAATAHQGGDTYKALHHTISTAAAMANWHAAISGAHTAMRPGIDPPTLIKAPDHG